MARNTGFSLNFKVDQWMWIVQWNQKFCSEDSWICHPMQFHCAYHLYQRQNYIFDGGRDKIINLKQINKYTSCVKQLPLEPHNKVVFSNGLMGNSKVAPVRTWPHMSRQSFTIEINSKNSNRKLMLVSRSFTSMCTLVNSLNIKFNILYFSILSNMCLFEWKRRS